MFLESFMETPSVHYLVEVSACASAHSCTTCRACCRVSNSTMRPPGRRTRQVSAMKFGKRPFTCQLNDETSLMSRNQMFTELMLTISILHPVWIRLNDTSCVCVWASIFIGLKRKTSTKQLGLTRVGLRGLRCSPTFSARMRSSYTWTFENTRNIRESTGGPWISILSQLENHGESTPPCPALSCG